MRNPEFLAEQVHRAYAGDAWYGPSVTEALTKIDARSAAAGRFAGAHTIWELVLHLNAWASVFLKRLRGEPVSSLSPSEDFPPIDDYSEAAWNNTLAQFRNTHDALVSEAAKMSGSLVLETAPGTDYSFAFMLSGIAQHLAYHAGQIRILAKFMDSEANR
jgi:uncharacterized damage-inducible protein DinB